MWEGGREARWIRGMRREGGEMDKRDEEGGGMRWEGEKDKEVRWNGREWEVYVKMK